MAEEDFLSQEEIDMLLQSLGKEEEKSEEQIKYRPFDINELERISPTRLVKLEQVVNRWVAGATVELRGIIFNLDNISLSGIKTEKISDFVLKIPLPAAIAVLQIESLNGRVYMVLDTRLIYTIISIIFGGPAQPYKVEGKSFTKFEQKIINNLIELLVKHLNNTWVELVREGEIRFIGIEDNPRRLITVSRNEIMIIITLEVEIEGFKGNIYLAIPMKTIEPIKDILRTTDTESGNYRDLILASLMNTSVTLEATFPVMKMRVRELLELKEGDFVPLSPRAPNSVTVKVAGVPMFTGVLGESSGRKAVKIKSFVKHHVRGTE
ncbi:flagellar motor switch protein FliM [Hydrogenivirga caldilitoris]|uniref:Flagellar motor switch protein FliM n=1 Tax=Hydrogenivirga caldilitoris TaxID=246264 RepID=A0A497XQG5_9AQUI|nr:FliM/FliN family flagellar motor switch protein [Hydrogenivirga caldilitoris]RLJ71128.1 flagellar motor switch protein FliM [Hydrogenivirga caldilitoris]